MSKLDTIVAVLTIVVLVPLTCSTSRAGPGLVLTVGPGGTHATIQSAVDSAVGSLDSSPVEIRVAAGAYSENITVPASLDHGVLTLSGGWSGNYTNRSADPTVTTIGGGAAGHVLDIRPSGGELTIEGFTITNGGGVQNGGGLNVVAGGDSAVTVENNVILGNTAGGLADSSANGGGIYAELSDTARLVVLNNAIVGNRCQPATGQTAGGGGIRANCVDSSTFVIRSNRIENNALVISGNQGTGAASFINTFDDASGEFSGNLIRYNSVSGGPTVGAASALWLNGTGRVTARGNVWVDNVDSISAEDVSLISSDTSTLLVTDSIIAGARAVGASIDSRDSSAIYVTNVTSSNCSHAGLFFRDDSDDTGTKTLFNSIVAGNGFQTTLDGVTTGNNLIDVDPMFADAAGRDYTPVAASPAIDAGNNMAPGGLGPTDVYGQARISSGVVDIGAIERGEPDYLLGTVATTVDGSRGQKITIGISIVRAGGHAETVTVSPPDVASIRAKFKPGGPMSTSGSLVMFKLKLKARAVLGVHQLTFTAQDQSGRVRTVRVLLDVH